MIVQPEPVGVAVTVWATVGELTSASSAINRSKSRSEKTRIDKPSLTIPIVTDHQYAPNTTPNSLVCAGVKIGNSTTLRELTRFKSP